MDLPFGERAAWFPRYRQASDERAAAAREFYGWLRRPGATAEEMAALAILDGRWPYGRIDPAWPFVWRQS